MRELKGDWRDLFHCFMIGLDLRKLLLAFIALAVTLSSVGVITYFFGTMVDSSLVSGAASERTCPVLPAFVIQYFSIVCPCLKAVLSDPFYTILYAIVIIPLVSVVWSYFGGAITRIAAVEIAKDERLETQKALEFVQGRFSSYFWALVASALGFLFFFLINAVVALPGRIPYLGALLQPVLMLLLPLALLSGFIMVLIAIGTFFGYPLFYPAISAEGTDSFDAISRGFSYVYSKPWHYILYQLVSTGYGILCVGFVWLFGWAMVKLTILSGGLGLGAKRMDQFVLFATGQLAMTGEPSFYSNPNYGGVLPTLAAVFFMVWMVVVFGFLVSYAVSFCLSTQTMVYFLLRKKVDGIEMNEIYEEKADEPAPLPVKPAAMPVASGTPAAPAPDAAPAPAPKDAAPAAPGGPQAGQGPKP